jgi:two-component system, NarL family, response regulator LiaR
MKDTIHVLLVDDHEIVRKGIIALLATEKNIQVIGEAGNGEEAILQAKALDPDVILMDLVMPAMDGIQAIQQIKSWKSDARILVLTSFVEDSKVFPAIKAGALGYLLKDSHPNDLIQAINRVYQGEAWLHPIIARKVLQELSATTEKELSEKSSDGSLTLTERETEVLRLVAQGLSNQEIADRLVISEATVRTHVSSLLNKLHLASRTQAALYALKQGLASLDD